MNFPMVTECAMARYALLITLILSSGCSLTRLALRTQAPLFEKGADSLLTERDWDWFREATPGNIQMMETLLSQDPGNQVMRRTLIKSYAGYGYSVFETLALTEILSDSDTKIYQQRALRSYDRAIEHGKIYLATESIRWSEIETMEEAKFHQLLTERLGPADEVAVVYLAQAWGAKINLLKHDITLVSQVPRVKLLFDWVCKRNPKIEHGLCPLFYAQYEGARPKMLGGNPELGEKIYQDFFQQYPHHLLGRMNYVQYVVVPRMDEELFEKELLKLDDGIRRWEAGEGPREFNFFNAVAKERLKIFKTHKKHLF